VTRVGLHGGTPAKDMHGRRGITAEGNLSERYSRWGQGASREGRAWILETRVLRDTTCKLSRGVTIVAQSHWGALGARNVSTMGSCFDNGELAAHEVFLKKE
jgi:hypothetical protein